MDGGGRGGGGGERRWYFQWPQCSHHVLVLGTEESGVVSLLYHDEGDAWLIVVLQFDARFTHTAQLML